MADPFLFFDEKGQNCTACGVEAKHFWLVTAYISKNHVYCLSCAFTKTKAKELKRKLDERARTNSTGAR